MFKFVLSLPFRMTLLVVLEHLALLALAFAMLSRPSLAAPLVAWCAVVVVALVVPFFSPMIRGYRLGRDAAREGRALDRRDLEALAREYVGEPPPPPPPPLVLAPMSPELRAQIDDAIRERWDRIAVRTLAKLEPTPEDCPSRDCPSAVHLRDALASALREADREEQEAMIAQCFDRAGA